MSVGTLELVDLAALVDPDHDQPCQSEGCLPLPAAWVQRCRTCGSEWFFCHVHKQQYDLYIERMEREYPDIPWYCTSCGTNSRTYVLGWALVLI